MSTDKDVHVVPHDDKWAVRRPHSDRVSRTFDTQQDAIDYGRGIAQRDQSELFIHRPDGRIRDRDSHGRDPESSKG